MVARGSSQPSTVAKRKEGPPPSPVTKARNVPRLTRLLLYVRSGGRCEFDDCNRYLLEHHVTLVEGNFAEMAHIYAFRTGGPRGHLLKRPANINSIDNLILLCSTCHKLIDKSAPGRFTVTTLQGYKRRHEQRIREVTGLRPEHRTAVLVVKARIGDQTVSVPPSHVFEAVSPRYPLSRTGTIIDLTPFGDETDTSIKSACEAIDHKIRWLVESQESELARAQHLSVFALAPMPVLMHLGSRLSNKVPVELYQRHRDTRDWTWKKQGPAVAYAFRQLRPGRDRSKVALVLSLSGTIGFERLPSVIDEGFFLYEITLDGLVPTPTFLHRKADLDAFRTAYHAALGALGQVHGVLEELHVFPAVPAPIAVLCGNERLPKVHPALMVYDHDKNMGGFAFRLRVP